MSESRKVVVHLRLTPAEHKRAKTVALLEQSSLADVLRSGIDSRYHACTGIARKLEQVLQLIETRAGFDPGDNFDVERTPDDGPAVRIGANVYYEAEGALVAASIQKDQVLHTFFFDGEEPFTTTAPVPSSQPLPDWLINEQAPAPDKPARDSSDRGDDRGDDATD